MTVLYYRLQVIVTYESILRFCDLSLLWMSCRRVLLLVSFTSDSRYRDSLVWVSLNWDEIFLLTSLVIAHLDLAVFGLTLPPTPIHSPFPLPLQNRQLLLFPMIVSMSQIASVQNVSSVGHRLRVYTVLKGRQTDRAKLWAGYQLDSGTLCTAPIKCAIPILSSVSHYEYDILSELVVTRFLC